MWAAWKSGTKNTLGIRFYGCTIYWENGSCKLFLWQDPEYTDSRREVITELMDEHELSMKRDQLQMLKKKLENIEGMQTYDDDASSRNLQKMKELQKTSSRILHFCLPIFHVYLVLFVGSLRIK